MILFTSDNGAVIDGPLPLNGAQKGYKSQTYPAVLYTPMFMWWGKENFNLVNYDKLISAMDFYPQLLMQPISAFQKTLSWMAFPCCPGCKIRNKASHIKI
ncbi:sulfatase-like hydrolase/transferase [Escherichia coli]